MSTKITSKNQTDTFIRHIGLFGRSAAVFMAVLLTFCGCDMLRFHPNEARFDGETGLTARHIETVEQWGQGRTSFCFALISDTQRSYDDTADAVSWINRHPEIGFVMHAGDLTDFGLADEYEWMRRELQRLNCPWITAIGNHDMKSNGKEIYRAIFGPLNSSFTVGNTRFVVLNTVGSDNDGEDAAPDFSYISAELAEISRINRLNPDSISQSVVMMHVRPFDGLFNNSKTNDFHAFLTSLPNLLFCMNGHDHHLQSLDIYDDGTLFHEVPNIHKRQLMVFTISPGSYAYECIDF
ncbi:MAG: metallophosphoesterase [Bacteroidales bacterium]|nr:metallophosphoesterase [Candidatus Liminaster caballi]